MRGVRGGLPGAHRARRQDRRAAPQPGPGRLPFPAGIDARVPGHGGAGQPVGAAGVGAAGLDAAAAVRGADGGVGGGGRRARQPRGPVLGRVCRGVRSAQSAGREGGGDVPPCRGCPVRGAGAGGIVHRRPGPPHGQRIRLPDAGGGGRRHAQSVSDGRAHDRDRLSRIASIRSATNTASWAGSSGSSTTASSWPSWSPRAVWRPCRRTRRQRPATTGPAA